jgi:DNA end-binding protein Ku
MAIRHAWEGYLQLSLISIPVKAFNSAISGEGEFHFHQLHKGCGERIKYKKTCPVHGEVSKEEIISGYEYQKGTYLELDPSDIAKVKAKKDELISIDSFVAPDKIDVVHLSGKTFYLVPDGPAGKKSYNLLLRVMEEKKRHAIAGIVLSGHEQRVLIRPMKNMLVMSVLLLDNQVKQPSDFAGDLGETKITSQELKLASSLIDASTTTKIDFSEYKDLYKERMQAVLDAKLAGKKIAAPPSLKIHRVVNLMDALRKSLKKTDVSKKAKKVGKPRVAGRIHGRSKAS